MKFSDMGLAPSTLGTLKSLGFITPTPIQKEAIPVLLKTDRDFIGLASTGTGKTAAFGLPMLEQIEMDVSFPQGIVLCPTRELCLQITKDLQRFSKHRSKLKIVAVYGGSPIVRQIRELKQGAQVIVATPGRLLDLIERRVAKLDRVSIVILDEADEMLNMGFKEELDKILEQMPDERVTWLFSATMAKGVEQIAQNYQTDPIKVSVGGRNEAAENISHLCFMVHEKDRYQALKRILDFLPEIYGLVFCRTRAETQQVAEKLMQDGYRAEALHGDLSQTQRDTVMRKFRQKTISILVATDVAARGLDVENITHVIQYKLSDEVAAYTHRCGRTARAGKSGVSITIINIHERRRIAELEQRNKIKIHLEKIPDGRAICENQLIAFLNKMVDPPLNEEEIKSYLPLAYEALEDLDKKEIIKRFISVEFNHFLEYYRHAGDINVRIKKNRDLREESKRADYRHKQNGKSGFQRFSINMGRKHKINAGAIVRLICEHSNIASNQIGEISLGRDQSFLDIKKEAVKAVRNGMKDVRLEGRKISLHSVSDKSGSRKKQQRHSNRR